MDPGRVMTVCGPVPPSDLGRVDAHDHVLIAGGLGVRDNADLRIDDPILATRELEAFKRSGGGTVVDCMPLDCGRDPLGLIEVSRASGVHVVAVTGFHTPRYYDDLHWTYAYDAQTIADLLVAEVHDGMDRYSYSGPVVHRLDARPGVVKWATEYNHIAPVSLKLAEAVADCHRRTGIPVITHAERGTMLHEQLDVLEELGVEPGAVMLSHADRNPDPVLHQEVAARGAFVIYDGPSRLKYHPVSTVVDLIAGVCAAGHADRVLLGLDHALRSQQSAYGGDPGIGFLLERFVPRLEVVLDDATVRKMVVDNPARALEFRPVR